MGMRNLIRFAAALCLAASPALAEEGPMPAGVKSTLSEVGQILVDANGMSLYTTRMDVKPGKSSCTSERITEALMGSTTFNYPVPGRETRKSCAEKWPALLAAADAKPSGLWSVVERDDGSKQWAYDGRPLYRSVKDKAPGDVNGGGGGFALAAAPLPGAPPLISTQPTPAGLVLATFPDLRTLYMPTGACNAACEAEWAPLPAPALSAASNPEWAVIVRADGQRQWSYKGKGLYTHARDAAPGMVMGAGRQGFQAAVLRAAPGMPAEITTKLMPSGKQVYADKGSQSLYTFRCNEETSDDLSCDDQGDASLYWVSMCGGPSRCMEVMRPVLAPADAQPRGRMWTVALINPADPSQLVTDESQALRVWAYRGKPVFTYAGDRSPDQANGHRWMYGVSGFGLVQAYGDSGEAY